MKKIALIVFLLLGFISAKAQFYISGVDISTKSSISYIQIVAYSYSIENKPGCAINIDYGQGLQSIEKSKQKFMDGDGKEIVLTGVVHAMNLLAKNGWVYKSESVANIAEGITIYRYLFGREE